MGKLSWLLLVVISAGTAAVVDRVAVVVGKTVITESEVQQEVRLTAFLNGQPLDLGPQQRRAAAERLVDQQLIRNEMEIGNYPQPSANDADNVLRAFQKEHYPSPEAFQAELQKYGITEELLKQHLVWQFTALHFTDVRFGGAMPSESTAATSADRQATADGSPATVDQQMEAWLKEARAQTRVQFKKEAFE